MSRLNWNRPRRPFTPWYDRDLLPETLTIRAPAKVGRSTPPLRVTRYPAQAVVKSPALATGAFAGPAALRTWDLVQARQSLAAATEAVVFCDGACVPNPGVEGMGAVIVAGAERVEIYNGGGPGTNNSAELGAAILALESLPPQCRATVYADSQYVIFGMTKWAPARLRKLQRGAVVPNADLWRALDALNAARSIRWDWVRGHSGNAGNQLADQLATLGRGTK
jgi:ribonuclease HI